MIFYLVLAAMAGAFIFLIWAFVQISADLGADLARELRRRR